jgi:16S rRNA (uracil1498-N3)-methyltransferase
MPDNRYFLKERFRLNEHVYLEGPEAHHLSKVMRKKEGAIVELVNGRHELAHASVVEISKDQVILLIEEVSSTPPQNQELILALALPKTPKLEWVIEKGTELGVDTFCLFPGVRSEKPSLSPNQQTRLEHLTIAALKQCGRLSLPKIEILKPLKFWDSLPQPAFFGSLLEKAAPMPKVEAKQLMILIGPEAGWALEEEEHMTSLGAASLKLHKNILRAETAAICAISQASYLWDFQ